MERNLAARAIRYRGTYDRAEHTCAAMSASTTDACSWRRGTTRSMPPGSAPIGRLRPCPGARFRLGRIGLAASPAPLFRYSGPRPDSSLNLTISTISGSPLGGDVGAAPLRAAIRRGPTGGFGRDPRVVDLVGAGRNRTSYLCRVWAVLCQ